MKNMSKTGALLSVGALVLTLAACSDDQGTTSGESIPVPTIQAPDPTAQGPTSEPVTEAPEPSTSAANGNVVDAFSIPVPSCFDTEDINAVQEVTLVDCNTPHDSEAYASYVFTDATFPGDDVIESTGNQFCYDEFTAYIGKAWEESEFDFYYLYPIQETWDQMNDREVLCIVQAPTQESAPMAGSNR